MYFKILKKSFVNVDGLFLCLKNGGNSPQEKPLAHIMINIYFKNLKTLDKVGDDFKNWP